MIGAWVPVWFELHMKSNNDFNVEPSSVSKDVSHVLRLCESSVKKDPEMPRVYLSFIDRLATRRFTLLVLLRSVRYRALSDVNFERLRSVHWITLSKTSSTLSCTLLLLLTMTITVRSSVDVNIFIFLGRPSNTLKRFQGKVLIIELWGIPAVTLYFGSPITTNL